MTVTLSRQMEAFVKRKLENGGFASPEEVVEAALAQLQQEDDLLATLPPGELNRLLEEGMADVAAGRFHDGEEVFRELEQLDQEQNGQRPE